jgi:eukaryotic-like serine/threonine-protein kinase
MILLAGKYRIERVLGQGGMGVVVSAIHAVLDERVAVKLLLPEALSDPELVARFQREARAAVRIKSEHVARVIDVGVVDAPALPMQAALGVPATVGAPFIVMEYLEGRDLAAVLRATGPLFVTDATSYVAQAIEAIAEAHSLGIIHRDLKPANLFLTHRPDGTPLIKVLDFGISKTLPSMAPNAAAMTATNAVLGSPMYMAPEQMIASRDVDGRTDVWALGAVLYQLLSGHGPFAGTTMAELCARILQEPHPPLRSVRAAVPLELDRVVARCLEKDRTRRYPSVAALAEALVPFGGSQAVMSAGRARRLIPSTERVVLVPNTDPSAQAVPLALGAVTNPSWSATRGPSRSTSAIWLSMVIAFTAIVMGAAIAVFVIAARAPRTQHIVSSGARPAETATTLTLPTPIPSVSLAPLHLMEPPVVAPALVTTVATSRRVPPAVIPFSAAPPASSPSTPDIF